jgi:hypothetical protein
MVAMLAAQRVDVAAMVFCGPMLYVGEDAASVCGCSCCYPLGRPCTNMCAAVDPRGPGVPLSLAALTTNKDEIDTIRHDPLYFDLDILNKTGQEVFKMADVCRENVPSFTVSSSHTVQHNITVMCMYVCTRSRFCVCTALTTESLCSKVTYETITTVQLTMYYVCTVVQGQSC